MINMNQKYPNRLKQTIKESGYTIEGIAAETNIPARTLFDYCAGRVPIPKYRLEVFAHALGYPTEYLVPKVTKEAVQQANIERELESINRSVMAHETSLQHFEELIKGCWSQDMDTSRRNAITQLLGIVGVAAVPPNIH